MFPPARRHRRFLRASTLFVAAGSAFAMCIGVALGQVDVKFLDGPWKVTVVGGDSASASSARRVRAPAPDLVGTHIIAADYDKQNFDREDFVDDMRAVVERQKAESALRLAQGASASSATSRRSLFGSTRRSSVPTSPEDEAERERIRQLFQDQPENERPSVIRSSTAADEVEQERIRSLLEDQPRKSSARSSSTETSPEDEAERERIRGLFFDREGVERPASDERLNSADQAEQERVRRLFQDQSNPAPVRVTRLTSACPRSRSLLAIFGARNVFCGEGLEVEGLINGDCPISACILTPSSEALLGNAFRGVGEAP